MQIDKIIGELTHFDRLPVAAIAAASADRAVAVPAFLREIDRYLGAGVKARQAPSPLFLIVHLLGAWREKSAYRPITRLFRIPSNDIESLLGDAVTATSHRIMAGVFDGDPLPLQNVIADAAADEFIRSRMFESLAMVTLQGELPAAESARFLRTCVSDLKPQHDSQVWFGWQIAIAMLGLEDMTPMVQQAFERGWIDPALGTFAQFQSNVALMRHHPATRPPLNDEQYTLLGDVVEEMSRWHDLSGR